MSSNLCLQLECLSWLVAQTFCLLPWIFLSSSTDCSAFHRRYISLLIHGLAQNTVVTFRPWMESLSLQDTDIFCTLPHPILWLTIINQCNFLYICKSCIIFISPSKALTYRPTIANEIEAAIKCQWTKKSLRPNWFTAKLFQKYGNDIMLILPKFFWKLKWKENCQLLPGC